MKTLFVLLAFLMAGCDGEGVAEGVSGGVCVSADHGEDPSERDFLCYENYHAAECVAFNSGDYTEEWVAGYSCDEFCAEALSDDFYVSTSSNDPPERGEFKVTCEIVDGDTASR
jgi:hypothetical protein